MFFYLKYGIFKQIPLFLGLFLRKNNTIYHIMAILAEHLGINQQKLLFLSHFLQKC